MKAGNVVAIGLAACALWWLKSRKKLIDSSMITLKGVNINGTILNPELSIDLLVINDSNQTQDINKVEGQILLNDKIIIGNVLQLQKQTIAPNATSVINIPVSVRLSGIIDTITSLITNKHGKFTFLGIVNVYGLNVPVNQSYTL